MPFAQPVVFRVTTLPNSNVNRLNVVGSAPELGNWSLDKAVTLECAGPAGAAFPEGTLLWVSKPLEIPAARFPLEYRYVSNGHRHSPTNRPLIWDLASRRCSLTPADGAVVDSYNPTPDDSASGWVCTSGMGRFQLRVGQPPGSTEPLAKLEKAYINVPVRVQLYEAKPGDPNVPHPKPFARVSHEDLGYSEEENVPCGSLRGNEHVTFLMNSQTMEALAFRVDVISVEDGRLLARTFISPQTLEPLEGTISATLMTPDLQQAGWFQATFLVVTACDHPQNNLQDIQRRRWSSITAETLDIGHRGSGADKGKKQSVRENTLLSFTKAAVNHSDFIEFDVHVTADGEVIVHHDFDVKLTFGHETIHLGIPSLSYEQLSSTEFTQYMAAPAAQATIDMLDFQRDKHKRVLKRNMSSAEDMFRSALKPSLGSPEPVISLASPPDSHWRISDRIATLREAFRQTPPWLGFNIELKYPTNAQKAAMTWRFYSRNYFCDAILKVVFDEAKGRKVIFSTFDPDCATLMSLKQPRYPVFFLTCGGTYKQFSDPRMNSLEAALVFASSSQLQGVVTEASAILGRLDETVEKFHRAGLFLFTFGDGNNLEANYAAQKKAGVDAIIMDDVARLTKANGKKCSLFNKPIQTPAACDNVQSIEALTPGLRSLSLSRTQPNGAALRSSLAGAASHQTQSQPINMNGSR
ncbi:hypothetical protein WJX72_006486 [[Myrmecia] bisecta]|uniref:glycerophosphodiester phosphodiesterase n=1 Tax=[Myrmecia] bisecta TaxID=41462 RepID=A0AAW1PX01_9CHLO